MIITIFIFMPIIANAESPITGTMSIGDKIGGTAVNLEVNDSDTGWNWSKDTKTLTLYSNYTHQPININCNSDNTINIVIAGDVTTSYIRCDGNLNVSCATTENRLTISGSLYNISRIESNGNISIVNSAITSNINCSAGSYNYGLHSVAGNIEISGSSQITTTMLADSRYDYSTTFGIYAPGDITISDNAVVIINGDVDYYGLYAHYGIYSDGGDISITDDVDIDVTGKFGFQANKVSIDTTGTVITKGNYACIDAKKGITISKGTIVASIEGGSTSSSGIRAINDIEFSGSANITSTGSISSSGYFNIKDNTQITANAGIGGNGINITGNANVNVSGSMGLYSNSSITIDTTGTVTSEGAEFYSIRGKDVFISNGTVIAKVGGIDATNVEISGSANVTIAGIYTNGNINIKDNAQVTATAPSANGTAIYGYNSINITGNANVKAGGIHSPTKITIGTTGTVTAEGIYHGLCADGEDSGEIIISNGTVIATATATDSYGIYAKAKIEISGLANVTAEGTSYGIRASNLNNDVSSNIAISTSTVVAKATGLDSYGIYAKSNVEISGLANVTAEGTSGIVVKHGNIIINTSGTVTAKGSINGIIAMDDRGYDSLVVISNGTVAATGTEKYGIYCASDITFSGGSNVVANGGLDGSYSWFGNINIDTTGTVTSKGVHSGIRVYRNLTISKGTVVATGNSSGLIATKNIIIKGNVIVYASGKSPIVGYNGYGSNAKGIVFTRTSQKGNFDGMVYSKVILPSDLIVGTADTLVIPTNATLIIPVGKTLTNKGTIYKLGTLTILGKYLGNPPITTIAVSALDIAPIKDQAYNGKVKKPTLTVKLGKLLLKENTHYTVKHSNKKTVGKVSITIKGKGKFKGTRILTYKIIPPKTYLSKLVVGKKQIKVAWKGVSGTTKYEVRYKVWRTSKWKMKSVSGKTTSLVLKKMKKGKLYQVQVRSYKTDNKIKYFSAWSDIKTIKVK
jgi:hypothetical protein